MITWRAELADGTTARGDTASWSAISSAIVHLAVVDTAGGYSGPQLPDLFGFAWYFVYAMGDELCVGAKTTDSATDADRTCVEVVVTMSSGVVSTVETEIPYPYSAFTYDPALLKAGV